MGLCMNVLFYSLSELESKVSDYFIRVKLYTNCRASTCHTSIVRHEYDYKQQIFHLINTINYRLISLLKGTEIEVLYRQFLKDKRKVKAGLMPPIEHSTQGILVHYLGVVAVNVMQML